MNQFNQVIPKYCELYEITEFAENVAAGGFIPYDGDGYFATSERMSPVSVWRTKTVPEGATHVAWFNR